MGPSLLVAVLLAAAPPALDLAPLPGQPNLVSLGVPEVLQRISPLEHVDALRVPLFVIQGKNDPRVPQSEAEQIVQAVRAKGKEVWYLLALDEGHGFQKKENRGVMTAAVALFLERRLLGSGAAGPR